MFEIPRGNTRKWWTVPLAMLGEFSLGAILISMSVMHVQVSNALVSRMVLFAPAVTPPPPPPPAGVRREPVKVVARKFDPARLRAPVRIPALPNETATNLPELPEAPDIAGIGGIPGGVPGGVLGGIPGGVLGGILNSLPSVAPPPVAAPAAKPAPPSRISVGGNVQTALLLSKVSPPYPPLAKAAHVDGTVSMKAVVGCDGRIKDLTLISGPPLLVNAAMAAVRQWIYRPTLLNGLPVEVDTEINVNFAFM